MMTFFGLMAAVITLALAGCFILWILTWTGLFKEGVSRRGFEVKPTTGAKPVLRQKENDHG